MSRLMTHLFFTSE